MTRHKILIVDDDKNIRLLLSQCLEENEDYEVTSAVDGEHALAKVDEESFDLVLLDMKLPGMDGLQVLRRLRALSPDQLVIVITAHGTIETAVEAMKLGAVDYLQKPFTPDEIRAIVKHNLSKVGVFRTEQGGGENFAECIAQARKFLEKRQVDEAMPFLRRAINLDPEKPETFNLLGAADEMSGNVNAARRMYRVALSLDPSYEPANENLIRVSQWKYDPAGVNLGNIPGDESPEQLQG